MQKKKKRICLSTLSNVVQLYDKAFESRYDQIGALDSFIRGYLRDICSSLGTYLSVLRGDNYSSYDQESTVLIGTYDFFLNKGEKPIDLIDRGWKLILITSSERQYEEMSAYQNKLIGLIREKDMGTEILLRLIMENAEV